MVGIRYQNTFIYGYQKYADGPTNQNRYSVILNLIILIFV